MKRSEAAKYARWSAAAALLLATLTAGVYLERNWVAYREKQKAPPAAPQDVTRLSSGLTFSKEVGTQKIFTVQASKATDFRDKDASLLEDVKITIFGKSGERHDTIHTQSCQYEKSGGNIACSGEVQFDLESKAEAERAAKNPETAMPQKVHVETRGVVFNRASGFARTDQPVKFVFPNGNGQAVGVEYLSEEGTMRLLKDVQFSLTAPRGDTEKKRAASARSNEPIRVTGKSLDFGRESRTMQLYGPVEAETRATRMHAGKLTLTLDAAFRAEKLVAAPGPNGKTPELESQSAEGSTNLSADTITAQLAPEGWLTRIEGSGGVRGSRRTGKEIDDFRAERGAMELWPKVNQPRELNLKGSVQLKTQADTSGEERTLQTNDKPVQTATAQSGTAQLPASGGWSQMDLHGNVRLKEGDHSGQAEHATFERATQTAVLTGKALARDATSETQAPRITFVQATGEILAEGGVRSTEFSAKGGGAQLAAVPANISADRVQANSKAGRALYTGHARLWQGDSVMEADSIELLRDARVMNATGNVRAIFPQAASQSTTPTGVLASSKKAKLWHVTAGTSTYSDAESRAHLEKNVVAQSAEQKMRAATVDLYFTRTATSNSNGTTGSAPANPAAGGQQISRAVGTGGVIVEQGTRKATADRGEYSAIDGKFVMSGGNPTILDSVQGTTTGHQLTFFLADDTIIVDSENGSRTLTRHRVDK